MTEAGWARESEKQEIIEFIDYVFSKAHRPHDFATLLPKVYGDNGDGTAHHFIVRENGKLIAAILCYPIVMHMGSKRLTGLGIGSVSTHAAARGRGIMKQLMDAADARAEETGAAFAVLSGLRQRYEHFGYAYGGYQMNAKLTAHNVSHALDDADTEDWTVVPMNQAHVQAAMALHKAQICYCERSEAAFLDILRSWNNEPFVLLKAKKFAGYGTLRRNAESTHIAEMRLECEADFAAAMKMLFEKHGTLTISAAPWEKARAAWLSCICHEFTIGKNHVFKVYQPESIREACAKIGFATGGFAFDGFTLPLPLYVGPPDCV